LESQAKEQSNYEEDALKSRQDHDKQMRRMEQDYAYDMIDAMGSRDAIAASKIARQYEVNRQRAEEDFGDQDAQRKKDFDKRMAEMDQQNREENQKREDNRKKQIAEIEKQYTEDFDALKKSIFDQRAANQKAYEEEREALILEETKRKAQFTKDVDEMLASYGLYRDGVEDANIAMLEKYKTDIETYLGIPVEQLGKGEPGATGAALENLPGAGLGGRMQSGLEALGAGGLQLAGAYSSWWMGNAQSALGSVQLVFNGVESMDKEWLRNTISGEVTRIITGAKRGR
jgi:hypothetical protein